MTSITLVAPARAAWLLAFTGALLLSACGGGTSEAVAPGPERTPAVADSTPVAAAPAVDAIAPRGDGLTGAPVPRLEAQSSEFDASRLNQTAGRFPPLDDPTVVSANEAPWLEAETLVLGAVQNGEARAYPIAMMTFHHVANDVLGGEPYLVTF